ncbi:MAG: glycosyltransferase [Candidatus Cloacimonetes bacterium]|nr:glycosyltransferase [Candidatus Cloacimonadota bacterium]
MAYIVIFFSLLLLLMAAGIQLNKKKLRCRNHNYSILIPCRNESANLPRLFQALDKINYPEELYEIILVDDASMDNTNRLLQEFCNRKENARYFTINVKDSEFLGKKAALQMAAEKASHDILLFTDADCTFAPDWLQGFNYFMETGTGFIAGWVMIKGKNAIARLHALISAGIFAATIGLGIPFSAAGGNMAVTRQAFISVGGYSKIKNHISGDDKLLLNIIKKQGYKIRFNPSPAVYTAPVVGRSQRRNRYRRKYGKFFMSPLLHQLFTLAFLFFFLFLLICIFFKPLPLLIFYLPSLWIFYLSSCIKLRQKFGVPDIIILPILPYIMIYYAISAFILGWEWKGVHVRD